VRDIRSDELLNCFGRRGGVDDGFLLVEVCLAGVVLTSSLTLYPENTESDLCSDLAGSGVDGKPWKGDWNSRACDNVALRIRLTRGRSGEISDNKGVGRSAASIVKSSEVAEAADGRLSIGSLYAQKTPFEVSSSSTSSGRSLNDQC
jgi:hypothetical protein